MASATTRCRGGGDLVFHPALMSTTSQTKNCKQLHAPSSSNKLADASDMRPRERRTRGMDRSCAEEWLPND
eukprot:2663550-Amphidinium_carterae.1